jgi:hypothetical protein
VRLEAGTRRKRRRPKNEVEGEPSGADLLKLAREKRDDGSAVRRVVVKTLTKGPEPTMAQWLGSARSRTDVEERNEHAGGERGWRMDKP